MGKVPDRPPSLDEALPREKANGRRIKLICQDKHDRFLGIQLQGLQVPYRPFNIDCIRVRWVYRQRGRVLGKGPRN